MHGWSVVDNTGLPSDLPNTMRYLLVALVASLPLSVAAQSPATDCSALQAEVETLRAQLRTLQAAPNPTASPAAALPGIAAKPAATQRLVIEEPYSRSGCRRGLLKGVAPARWQDADLWLDLEKGQSPAQVEALLGSEHFDESGGGNVIWHYGKCGATSLAQVLFSNGKLSDWRVPSR